MYNLPPPIPGEIDLINPFQPPESGIWPLLHKISLWILLSCSATLVSHPTRWSLYWYLDFCVVNSCGDVTWKCLVALSFMWMVSAPTTETLGLRCSPHAGSFGYNPLYMFGRFPPVFPIDEKHMERTFISRGQNAQSTLVIFNSGKRSQAVNMIFHAYNIFLWTLTALFACCMSCVRCPELHRWCYSGLSGLIGKFKKWLLLPDWFWYMIGQELLTKLIIIMKNLKHFRDDRTNKQRKWELQPLLTFS